jgi:hypothetical protein
LRPLFTDGTWSALYTASQWLLGLATVLTIVSGIRYVVDAWPLFRPQPAAAPIVIEERPRVVKGDRAG